MSTSPHVSVVIPTYRRRDLVAQALVALRRQTLDPSCYEVIVVVDGSEDGTHEMVTAFAAPYALHSIRQANGGRASACNTGIRAAAGQLVVLLDDDMEASPHLLAAHIDAHPPGSRLGVIGAAPILVDDRASPALAYAGKKFNALLDKLAQPERPIALRDFYSGNFSVKRRTLLEIGLFDEAFRLYGHEDLELSLRLARAGVQLAYSPAALARQHNTKDFAGLARDAIAKGKTAVLLAGKHPEIVPELRLSTYDQASRKWRVLRGMLLAAGRRQPRCAGWVADLATWLAGADRAHADLYFQQALDYCFWFGVESAYREADADGPSTYLPPSLAGKAHH
jgi:GT2 family glycosyltransferase